MTAFNNFINQFISYANVGNGLSVLIIVILVILNPAGATMV